MNEKEIQEFLQVYEAYQLHKKTGPASNNTAQLVHGPTGLFSGAGLNPEVFSAMLQPAGLGAVLPAIATRFTNPQFAILTGQEADVGNEPTDSCGDPVRAGFKKLCTMTAQFGMLQRGTNTIDPSKIITLLHRGEFTDLNLIGSAIPDGNAGFAPSGMPDPQAIINNAIAMELSGVAVSFVRNLSSQLWTGAVAGGTAGYQQFPGLDSQITTGHVDSVSNTLCPAADSDVKDFDFNNVDGTDGRDIVEYISMLEFYVTNIAQRVGLTCEWVWVMRPELWQELTSVWPIAYNTNRGTSVLNDNKTVMMVDGGDMIALRDQMRRSLTIEVNGRTYRVVLDDGINEKTNITNAQLAAGEYASDIYFVPLRANGFPVTRLEYLDYRLIQQMLAALADLSSKVSFWTNDGMFLWAYRDLPGFCFDIVGRTEMRVVLQTPFLAGRLQNVKYIPLQHIRQARPGEAYWVNGGVSTRTDLSNNYAVWDNR